MRVLLGGIVGGILLFAWSYVDHMLLPFGRMGISQLPNEAKLLTSLKADVPQPGVYFFPWISDKPTPEEQKAWAEKYTAGPSGLLALAPPGREPISKKMLGIELGSDILAAMLGSWVLTVVAAGYGGRVAVFTMLGLFGWVAIEVSYWNWYGFPTNYALAQLAEQGIGSLVAGLAVAAIVKPPSFSIDTEVPL